MHVKYTRHESAGGEIGVMNIILLSMTTFHSPPPNDDDDDEDTTAVILRSAQSLLSGRDRSISRVLISYFIHYYTCTNIYRCFHWQCTRVFGGNATLVESRRVLSGSGGKKVVIITIKKRTRFARKNKTLSPASENRTWTCTRTSPQYNVYKHILSLSIRV